MALTSVNRLNGTSGQKSRTTSSVLIRLIWWCILPLVVLALFLAAQHILTLRRIEEQAASDQLRNVATAIERHIGAQIAAL